MKVKGWQVACLWFGAALYFLAFTTWCGWVFTFDSSGPIEGLLFGAWMITAAVGLLLLIGLITATDTWTKGGNW